MKILTIIAVSAMLGLAMGCGGGGMSTSSNLTISLSSSSATMYQGSSQNSVTVSASLSGGTAATPTFSATGLPVGATFQAMMVLAPKTPALTWNLVFNSGTAAAGTYPLTVMASSGSDSATASLSLIIGAASVISATQTQPFSLAMSTAFQPAEWDNQFFTLNAGLNPLPAATLGTLGPHNIRLQGISQGVPQGAADSASTTWNFSILDDIVQPVLAVGDHSPEFQIAKAPPFMYVGNNSGGINEFTDLTFAQFAGYAANLVQYYNVPGGFMSGGNSYASPSGLPITWWGIYNEPSINNNLKDTDYVTMYNAVVPAMQAAGSSIPIKFVGLEMCCSSEDWATTFAQNVTAQVDAVASHYYSSCDQLDPDTKVMGTVPGFITSVQTIHTNLSGNPLTANLPIWVTENNVNADYDAGNNMSACNPGQTFVTDLRGSSPFFAAWRPYVFSKFGKTGLVPMLYHWDYDADQQFGEVDYSTGALQLSYWVDYWLGQEFPPTAGSHLLNFTPTDDAELETLPVINGDGSVTVMVANHTVNSSTDNNGPGSPRSILVDISALGTFSSGTLVTIDSTTSATAGPTPTAVTPAAQMTLILNGYSVAFLTLKP